MNCPRCDFISPDTALRCDCGYDFSKSEQDQDQSPDATISKSKIAMGAQLIALVLGLGAVVWGCCMIYVALNPGASGEFGGYSVLFAAVIDVPVGLISLAVGLLAKRGYPTARWVCLALSVVALAMPFLTKAAWQSQFVAK